MNRFRTALSVVLVTGLTATPGVTLAQAKGGAWPERPIRLIVPFPPGGGTDLVSRTLMPPLSAALGQQIVIDNRGGAQGLLGTGIAAKAAPDGYTLVISEIGATAVAPALAAKVDFDPAKDLAHITKLIVQPYIVSVHPSVPAKTVGELIKLAQSRTTKLNYGSGNTTAHVAQELFYRTAKADIQHVPYRGSGPAMTAVMGNEVQTIFSGPGAAIPQIRAGRIRGLAVTTAKRSPELPELPTLQEEGFKGFEISGWYGISAPAATPRPVLQRLNTELVKLLTSGEAAESLRKRGYEPSPTSMEEFGAYVRSELTRWARAVKEFGIKSAE